MGNVSCGYPSVLQQMFEEQHEQIVAEEISQLEKRIHAIEKSLCRHLTIITNPQGAGTVCKVCGKQDPIPQMSDYKVNRHK